MATADRRRNAVLDGLDAIDRDLEQAPAGHQTPQFHAELALYHCHRWLFDSAEHRIERVETCLNAAIDKLGDSGSGPGLFGGFCEVAWIVDHVARHGPLEFDAEETNRAVDELLLDILAEDDWRLHYDLISGLAGIATYFLHRPASPLCRQGLAQVLRHLEQLARRDELGATWHTAPEHLPEHQRCLCPAGYVNLGVAHGVPSVVFVLAALTRFPSLSQAAHQLLDAAIPWLVGHRLESGTYPATIAEGTTPTPQRLAWCYGDLGIASVFLQVGRQLSRSDLTDHGVALAHACAARRTPEQTRVVDAGICHGAAGNFLLFARMQEIRTGDELIADAACHWLEQTLNLRRPGRGVGGYQAYLALPGLDDGDSWVDDASLLTGAIGIGLALQTALDPSLPKWDGMLLSTVAA